MEDLGEVMYVVGQTIPAEFLKTVFVGVNLEND